ncbi:MAG: SIMPL domain-containing protein [Gammaproteobacteria bacterium]|nr:SIMPL domain-containing protein [Gammaproteobacteria bacterium]
MLNKQIFILGALILAFGIALGGFFVGHGLASRETFNRFVSVKGLAETSVKSDQAIWQMTVSSSANDLPTLYAGIAKAQAAAKGFWLNQGFATNQIDLQSATINDNQQYGSNNNGPRYTASANLLLITSNVDLVKAASQQLNLLVKQNVVLTNSQINYSFTALNQVKPHMLDEATTNAQIAAQAFAKNAGSSIGGIRDASQGQFTIDNDNNNGISSMTKKVRVVTTVDYFIR